MIEIFRHNNKWRIKIVNETLEFKTTKEFEDVFKQLVKLKEAKEPYYLSVKDRPDNCGYVDVSKRRG